MRLAIAFVFSIILPILISDMVANCCDRLVQTCEADVLCHAAKPTLDGVHEVVVKPSVQVDLLVS